jgi:putative ABC transport system permease protein
MHCKARSGNLGLSIRLARRELRGGVRGFRVFLASLALGVAAIAAIGSLAKGVELGLAHDGRAILGGDIEVRLSHRELNFEERRYLESSGLLSEVLRLRAIARNQKTDARQLAEIKAVDAGYPLFGRVRLEPDMPLAAALRPQRGLYGLVAEPELTMRLGLGLGDRIQIGDAVFELRAKLVQEPDRAADGIGFGPRALLSTEGLRVAGLIAPGSLFFRHYRLVLGQGVALAPFLEQLNAAFPEAGWRLRDWRNGNPSLSHFIGRMEVFLILVALSALLVGGVGVANAVGGYIDGKTETIGTLKSLGASKRLVFQVYLVQVLVLGLGGIVAGLAFGALAAAALSDLMTTLTLVPVRSGIYAAPLAAAALYGLLIALGFALWPLSRVRDVAPAGLFRDIVQPSRLVPPLHDLGASLAALVLLVVLIIAGTEDRLFASLFVAGSALAFIVLAVFARGLTALARLSPRPRLLALRWAIANMHRPGGPTASIVLSLGLGLALFVAIAHVQSSLNAELGQHAPKAAPAFFFLDIQPDQIEEFERAAASVPGVGAIEKVPALRGRITRIDGRPADPNLVKPSSRWVVQGDRMLTYSVGVPKGSKLIAGQWWPKESTGASQAGQRPVVSMEKEAAEGLGLSLGHRIAVNVMGREIEAEIVNLREVEWTSFGINFVLVFAPGVLEGAPHTYLATAEARGPAEERLFRAVTDRFANITPVRVRDVIEQLDSMLGKIALAVRLTAIVTLLAGVLVLAGALAASHRRRSREAVFLKVLGAKRADVLAVYFAEYAAIGFVTAAFASALGSFAGWLAVTQVFDAAWVAAPVEAFWAAFGAVALTVILGLSQTWASLSQPAAPVLRHN